MKKLILITTIILLNALLTINTQCDALNTSGQNFLQTLAARFAALKSYLFQPTSTFLKNRYQLQQQKPLVPPFATTPTPPFVSYNSIDKEISLSNNSIITQFDDIESYNLSPQKKYLIIKTKSPGLMLRLTGATQFFGYNQEINLISTVTGKIIKTFDGDVIMFEFSPDEKTLLMAVSKSPVGILGKLQGTRQKPSSLHQPIENKRRQKVTGEILFYEIFDIESKSIIAQFENVQTAQFTSNDVLAVKYDDNITENIQLIDKRQSRLIRAFAQSFQAVDLSPVQPNTFLKINYDDQSNALTITNSTFNHVNSYGFSPQKNYVIINKKPEGWVETVKGIAKTTGLAEPSNDIETIIFSTQSNTTILPIMNVITYEFSPDEKTLLVLNELPTLTYKLFNLLNNNKLIKEFTNIKSAYFTSNDELVAINLDDQKISYDTTTGETFSERDIRLQQEEKQRQKQEQERIEQERIAKEKQEQEKIAQKKQALEEIERKKKYEEDEKIKREAFAKLSEPEKRKAPIEELPEKQRLQKEDKQTIPGTASYAVAAVGSRGLSAIAQQAKDIASETASSIKEYLFPNTETPEVSAEKITPLTEVIVHKPEPEITTPLLTPTAAAPTPAKPIITPSDDSEDGFGETENKLEDLMNELQNIIDNKEQSYQAKNASISNILLNIIKEFNDFEDLYEYQEFVNLYNEFTSEQKQKFDLNFFLPTSNKKRSITNKNGETVIFSIDDNDTMSVAIVNKETSAAGGTAEQ